MPESTERNMNQTARQQFEQMIHLYAPYLDRDDFQLTSESEYAEVLQSIQDHKYLINKEIPFEISMDEALFAWYENVYHPMTRAIDGEGLLWFFPGATRGELFLRVTRHWNFLKQEKGGEISINGAVHSFGTKFGKRAFNRLLYWMKTAFCSSVDEFPWGEPLGRSNDFRLRL